MTITTRDRGFVAGTKSMWLVTKPTADSELVDILWECDWVHLGNWFRDGGDGSEIVGLYHHEQQARNVAMSLLAVRDGTLDAGMVTQ